jgi:hypothetical protein
MASNSYEVGRLGLVCESTGKALAPGDGFVAALCEGENGALVRHDFSVGAWEAGARPAGHFAFWRGVVPAATKSAGPVLNLESLLDLFEQLGESTDGRRQALRSIIALILIRKRVLQVAGRRDGVTLVRERGAAPESAPVEVADPALDAETLAQVTEELRTVLGIEA